MASNRRNRRLNFSRQEMQPLPAIAPTIFYHRTSRAAADEILRAGFRDATGYYLTSCLWSGVWLSNRPLDVSEGCMGDAALLEIELDATDAELEYYEWVEEGKTYREWLMPAKIVNRGKVRLVPE